MRTRSTQSAADWRHGYPDDYVTANAICLHDEFDPDTNPAIRIGFRPGYFPDPTYKPSLGERFVTFLESCRNSLATTRASGAAERSAPLAAAPRRAALPLPPSTVRSISYDGPGAPRQLTHS